MRRSHHLLWLLTILVAGAALATGVHVVLSAHDRTAGVRGDGKAFGSAPARVFTDDYDGPPVVGDELTRVPALAPLQPGNRTHHVRIDIVPQDIEVAPGVRYTAWTFGGSVPGPVLHVREGDRVDFTMKNRSGEAVTIAQPWASASPFLADLVQDPRHGPASAVMPMPHSMDFHSGTVAPDDKWRIIMPGQTIEFSWQANYPGVFLYHCGMAPVLQHLAMGQYGVVVVSPRDGYPTDAEVARSYVVVQSEFYLKPDDGDDGLSELNFDAAMAKQPSQVVFNGHVQALKTTPLVANAGERVRIYFNNVGPSDGSSLHIVGAIFDRVYYEGNPANSMVGMQTVQFGASSGGVLEFIAPEEGTYAIVDHEFADAQRGAVGYVEVRSPSGAMTRASEMMAH
jgi:nitrite reductase (NO-forming)